jgi:hypothetical protein
VADRNEQLAYNGQSPAGPEVGTRDDIASVASSVRTKGHPNLAGHPNRTVDIRRVLPTPIGEVVITCVGPLV